MKPEQNKELVKLASAQAGVISLEQAYDAELTDHQVRWQVSTGAWEKVGSAVFRVGAAPDGWTQKLWIACLQSGGVASHQSAARLFGLDGVGRNFKDVHVIVPFDSKRGSTVTEVKRSRTLAADHVSKKKGIPRTNLARTLIDLAGVLDEENLELAFDSGLRQQSDLRQWVRRLLKRMPRRGLRGIGALERLIDENAPAVDSALEVKLRSLVKRAGLPDPVPQYRVFDGNEFLTRVDFAWDRNDPPVALLGHGKAFHHNTPQWNLDNLQVRRLNAIGWRTVPCSYEDIVKRGAELIRDIKRMLAGHKQPPPPKVVVYE